MTYVHTYCTHVHTRTGCAEPIWTGQNGAMSAFCGKVHANNYDAGFKDDDDAEQGTAVQAPTVVYDVRLFNSSSFLRSLKHACLHPSCVVHRAPCVAASFFVERPPLRASLVGTNLFPARFRFLLYLVATPRRTPLKYPSDDQCPLRGPAFFCTGRTSAVTVNFWFAAGCPTLRHSSAHALCFFFYYTYIEYFYVSF